MLSGTLRNSHFILLFLLTGIYIIRALVLCFSVSLLFQTKVEHKLPLRSSKSWGNTQILKFGVSIILLHLLQADWHPLSCNTLSIVVQSTPSKADMFWTWAPTVCLGEVSALEGDEVNDWNMTGTSSDCLPWRGVCLEGRWSKWSMAGTNSTCPLWRGMHFNEVSVKRELTVPHYHHFIIIERHIRAAKIDIL